MKIYKSWIDELKAEFKIELKWLKVFTLTELCPLFYPEKNATN